ncbi:hypothetical protein SB48_HM08orf02057 [Heyndrickxia coagulans]|uniref:Uncharacterized protein n=1 Tax=Heyndrickxia coagulans TaxID=1398 RepID=A0AAN0WAS6_HEYCO|nr:hypothetical protein SB48_HM08orf02057 [Heyndrickxia coagulans]
MYQGIMLIIQVRNLRYEKLPRPAMIAYLYGGLAEGIQF